MIYLIPLVCLVIPMILGYVAVRNRKGAVVVVVALAAAGLAGWALWLGRQAQGWDGIGYAIVAVLMAAPAGLGVLIGAALAWWRHRRAG